MHLRKFVLTVVPISAVTVVVIGYWSDAAEQPMFLVVHSRCEEQGVFRSSGAAIPETQAR